MKKFLRPLPAFVLATATFLCLSLDSASTFAFVKSNETQSELFRETGGDDYKIVMDLCPDDETTSEDCLTGGSLQCIRKTCPGDTSGE